MISTQKHIPVMLKEVLQYLKSQDNKTYVDATFGNGGYTCAILDSANCKVIAKGCINICLIILRL